MCAVACRFRAGGPGGEEECRGLKPRTRMPPSGPASGHNASSAAGERGDGPIGRARPDASARVRGALRTLRGRRAVPDQAPGRTGLPEWKEEGYWSEHGRAAAGAAAPRPTQRTRTRIKRPEAVLDKFQRLAAEFPDGVTEDALPLMRDFLGARVIVYFPTHLRMVDEEIRSGRHFDLSTEVAPRCYIPGGMLDRIGLDERQFAMKGRKPSGYASLHYFVRLKVNPDAAANPWFELQTRTMLEEVWGEVEHQLGYKFNRRTEFSVSRQFRVISSHLAALDDHFDFVYDRLTYLQTTSNPAPGDILNAENLPKVLEDLECVCQQNEVAGMLDILETWDVNTVEQLRQRARPELLEAIRSEYQRQGGQERPTAFHIVSTLAHLTPSSTAADARRTLAGNLKLVELTNRMRRGKEA